MFVKALVFFGIIGTTLAGCDWASWSSCSQRCGGGTKSRKGDCGAWWGSHSGSDHTSCNKFCYNGGAYRGDRCHCPARRTGRCCESIKRCYQDNGGCVERCTPNSHGSTCGCRHSGYKLASDGRSCTDVNECSLHYCDQMCRNTIGSFVCSCHPGYSLSSNKRTCTDNNECEKDDVKCTQLCKNTRGSFHCECRHGYRLKTDGYSCEDVDECKNGNGGCSHLCTNAQGSYRCDCPVGFKLDKDGKTCKDIDECSIVPSKCQQACQNTHGSFKCECSDGFSLSSDGRLCEGIDDCIGTLCLNGGTCHDGVNSFTCSCNAGYTGHVCENDIDECAVFNGGCDDKCINTIGSFKCDCLGNKTLSSDGKLCSGSEGEMSVFENQTIHQQLLPRGCSTIEVARCTEGTSVKLLLSSTSPWFELKSNKTMRYTKGIVFVELDDLALPVSLTGVEVVVQRSDFSLTIGSVRYNESQGSPIGIPKENTEHCWSFDISPRYIYDFLQSLSFLKTFLSNIEAILPNWMSFSLEGTELFGLNDLQMEFLHGSDISKDPWCKGAPVLDGNLYSVFKFGADFSMTIYGDNVTLPKGLTGEQYCFIIDVCQDKGGSIFLMIPKESRSFLENFQLFKNLSDHHNLHIQPRGVGLSSKKHVNVNMRSTELELWNGDALFNYKGYTEGEEQSKNSLLDIDDASAFKIARFANFKISNRVFRQANLWIGGDVLLDYEPFHVNGKADVYFEMPSFSSLLSSLFLEEWNLLVQTDISADMRISFMVLGTHVNLNFKDIGASSLDLYGSIGGKDPRQWCGDGSNPPGFFFSAMVDVNPFKDIPILKDWVIDLSARLYVFITSSASTSSDDKIDILSDILELETLLSNFLNVTMEVVDGYGTILLDESISVLNDLELSINRSLGVVNQLVVTIKSNPLDAFTYDWEGVFTSFESIWSTLKDMISSDSQRFINSIEFQTNVSKHHLTRLVHSEIDIIQDNLKKTAEKLYDQVLRAVRDYKGFGFKFSTDLTIFGLHFGLLDLEAVHSVDHLGSCGKFKRVFELFSAEKSFRFLGVVKVPYRLGPFLRMQIGAGVGMAFSIESFKFLTQHHVEANLLGIRANADLFVNNNGIYLDIEGNLWTFFKARLSISADHGKEWDMLALRVHGELLGNGDGDDDFNDSYLDALRNAIKSLGDAATKRLTQAQNALSTAQSGLTSAQNWLEDKKADVRALNSKFDDVVRALGRAKATLEDAKGPFNAAIAKLNKAQRNVDRLCRIEHCRNVCVPGFKCKICHTGGWIHFPYPCCHLTSCMISFPNPICVVKNLACRAIRGVAYLALEAVKIFVRIPILALDVAKVALSVAQVVVDKARVVLDIAIVAIDIAQVGLEGAKGVLEVAKFGIEAVKQVLKLGFKVLDMIIEYGLKNLVDLKNCQFDVQLTTKDLPVFAVSCEVNVLRLGWSKIEFGVNFNHPVQSLWEAAKKTITSITDTIGDRLFGRKKRDLLHESLSKTHAALRLAREINPDLHITELELNETIDIVLQTAGFNNGSVGDDYENRVGTFKVKCDRFQKTFSYLREANSVLYEVANETVTMLNSASRMQSDMENFDINNIRSNFTIENTGIDPDVAMRDYNLTLDDLHAALSNANSSLKDDQLLQEAASASNISKDLLNNNTASLTNIKITDQWLLAMDNVTKDYFTADTCVSFLDCAHYSMAELLDIYYAEDFENISSILSTLSTIEDTFLALVGNSSIQIQHVYNLSDSIGSLLNHLEDMNPVCSQAPVFLSPLVNQTATRGMDTTLFCNVSADPEPNIWWYENGIVVPEEHNKVLYLRNVSRSESVQYICIAGNVIANLSSDAMYLDVKEFEDTVLDTGAFNNSNSDGKHDASEMENGDTQTDKDHGPEVVKPNEEESDLTKVLIACVTSGCVICLVAGIVIWRIHVRNKFRKSQKMGSFMSMNMVQPSAANVRFNPKVGSREVTTLDEQLQ